MKTIIPIAAISAGLFASDADFSSQLSRSPSRINTSNNIANFGVAAMVAGGGSMYLYGRFGGTTMQGNRDSFLPKLRSTA